MFDPTSFEVGFFYVRHLRLTDIKEEKSIDGCLILMFL